ncbi:MULTISPECIES: mechanosensitive ion channel family protein [Okeania]|uniref:Mechanosensitive ion channel family protein n=1 Tax=Okeania hirsuta TaxID=1458930 RepID=A0A3N6PNG6_9CYAN|nr:MULTISPECIES: mechanosensitive ion channel family protein [Okeania]NEP05358.1 mechanosensitive ion channel family protein [Okeania sp. SIO4D6]NEP39233.1 mechanosensitive ion channel family protein [Okeania sp. SIO2H7]NEP72777.1 mechanosensitive ion channel family protein [Okeania sp. SIO2G5]NEP93467.1 mechanosensitive ion channel family protein [Okeania sp. SIO2F5]NEQ89764.1 mechanosensitive ion channel family protein [Okeania sp. SIO2G4]
MEKIWQSLINITILDIPAIKIFFIALALIGILGLKELFSIILIKQVEALTRNTKTTLDDQLIASVKQPIGWFIYILGLWILQLILTDSISPQLNQIVTGIINLAIVGNVSLIIYRISPILGEFFSNLSAKTETELDDIISPYLPILFRFTAILIFGLKAGELLLGTSVTAIFGLVGGAGLTLGLLFKDVISDWLATVVIYSDSLYRENDLILLPSGVLGQVTKIGIRSTTIYLKFKGAIQKVPNSKMIDGNIKNFCQQPIENRKAAIDLFIKIDGISAQKIADINEKIRQIPKSIDILDNSCLVRFDGLDRNARVIRVIGYTNNLDKYYSSYDQLNLAILALLEQEGIDLFNINIISDTETYKSWQSSQNLGIEQGNREYINPI